MNKQEIKDFIYKILNGLGIGIIFSLVPGALVGEIMKSFIGVLPFAAKVVEITNISISLMPAFIGVCIAIQLQLAPMAVVTIAAATMMASGGVRFDSEIGAFVLTSKGDVINSLLTATIGVLLTIFLDKRLSSFKIIVLPVTVLVTSASLGLLILPYVSQASRYIGSIINTFTTLQPIVMCVLIAVSFSMIIVSPISTVGIALAIELADLGAGAANLGVISASFGLGISGIGVNNFGLVISHFISSPKIQIANFFRKPIMLLPTVSIAAVLGFLSSFVGIKGTPLSAGFGFAGFIGPVNAFYNIDGAFAHRIIIILLMYLIIPLSLAFGFKYLYMNKLKILSTSDYKIEAY